ncbi:MAG: hypothetical protein QM765_02790 [Myxococcales bacterium]
MNVFLGKSGAGKTTLARLACSQGAQVLSDDRTVLRFERGQLVAYGTPFHGKGRHWSTQSAPVRGLFFLEHAVACTTSPLQVAEATAKLAAVSFMPFWSAPAVAETLRLCERAAAHRCAHQLRFLPDTTALEAIDVATTTFCPPRARGAPRPHPA